MPCSRESDRFSAIGSQAGRRMYSVEIQGCVRVCECVCSNVFGLLTKFEEKSQDSVPPHLQLTARCIFHVNSRIAQMQHTHILHTRNTHTCCTYATPTDIATYTTHTHIADIQHTHMLHTCKTHKYCRLATHTHIADMQHTHILHMCT